jgi:hypothetical protein
MSKRYDVDKWQPATTLTCDDPTGFLCTVTAACTSRETVAVDPVGPPTNGWSGEAVCEKHSTPALWQQLTRFDS